MGVGPGGEILRGPRFLATNLNFRPEYDELLALKLTEC
jgi:hypothetical protein